MSAFTDAQIAKWALDYDKLICAKHDLIADRLSLAIIGGANEYEIPNYVTNIRSVLYLGKELHPKGFRASVLTGDTPFQTAGSIPYEYVFSGRGQRVLKFYPTPMDTIAEYIGDLWTPAADEAAVIVEFYRTPDNAYVDKALPAWLRRYLLKDYVCMKAFGADGPTQDITASLYYQERMAGQEDYLKMIKEHMNKAQLNVLYETKMAGRRKPGRPVLPPNFGYPINY